MGPHRPPLLSTSGGTPSQGLGTAGVGLMIAGTVTSAIGAYYTVQAAQYRAKAEASSLEYQQQLSYINARAAERDAQHSLLAGQREAGRAGLQYRQVKSTMRAQQAASGVQAGVGSAAEIAASIEYAKESDQLAITRNSVREANAARTGRVNALNRATMAGVSAANLRSTAGSMSPWGAGVTSLVGGAGQVASSWYRYKRTQ